VRLTQASPRVTVAYGPRTYERWQAKVSGPKRPRTIRF
jgi:hypothetical protein